MTDFEQKLTTAEAGDASSMSEVATAYYNGDGTNQDFAKAFSWYEKAASAGSVWSIYMLGVMHQHGQGVGADPAMMHKYFSTAAEKGHALSNFALGVAYQTGNGIDLDYKKALLHYRLAAEAGNANAAKNLGSMLHVGLGLDEPDFQGALGWYKIARSLGAKGTEEYINQIEAQLDPELAAINAIREFRSKPASLWDRLVGRR